MDWKFENPTKTGDYLCLIKYRNSVYKHEIMTFFVDGKDAGDEYAHLDNFWAYLDECWDWNIVNTLYLGSEGNESGYDVVAWSPLTYPKELYKKHPNIEGGVIV